MYRYYKWSSYNSWPFDYILLKHIVLCPFCFVLLAVFKKPNDNPATYWYCFVKDLLQSTPLSKNGVSLFCVMSIYISLTLYTIVYKMQLYIGVVFLFPSHWAQMNKKAVIQIYNIFVFCSSILRIVLYVFVFVKIKTLL